MGPEGTYNVHTGHVELQGQQRIPNPKLSTLSPKPQNPRPIWNFEFADWAAKVCTFPSEGLIALSGLLFLGLELRVKRVRV